MRNHFRLWYLLSLLFTIVAIGELGVLFFLVPMAEWKQRVCVIIAGCTLIHLWARAVEHTIDQELAKLRKELEARP